MFGERCARVTLVLVVLVLLAGANAWAAEAGKAGDLLREEVARERIVQQKHQAEARACLRRGRQHQQAGQYQEAQADLQRALELDPDLTEAGELLKKVREELGLEPVAQRLLKGEVRRREVAREALRARVESLLGEAARQRKDDRYDEALDTLSTAANLLRYSPDREQLSDLQRQVDREMQSATRQRERYRVRLQDERRREALAAATRRKVEAQVQLRATERELLSRAETLYAKGRYREATRLAQVVTKVDPRNTRAYVLLGKAESQASREDFLALSDKRAREYRTEWLATQEATRPLAERESILYPDNWKELSSRRAKMTAAALGEPKPAWKTRLQGQLTRPVTFEFTEIPLSEVVRFLATVSDVNIVLDRQGIQAAGKDPDMPITLKVKDTSLSDALDWITDLTGLTYVLRNGAVLISDPSQSPGEKRLAVYDVRDLLASTPDFQGQEFDLSDESSSGGGGGGTSGGFSFTDETTTGTESTENFVSTQMSGEDLVQFIIQALGLEGE